jgi:aspartate/methionine/tyrosine aminotransferase
MHISMTYLNPADVVFVPNPGYPTYRSTAMLAGATVVDYILREKNNWFPDLSEIEDLLIPSSGGTERRGLMWINYPQMPTGKLPTKELFEDLVEFGKKNNILICHDNPYSFILNDKPMSILAINGAKDVAIELNSLSKSQNMAGWRVGMMVGAKERIDEVMRFKSNMDSGMFLPVQLAAAKALSLGSEWYEQVNAVYRERRIKAFKMLDLLQCEFDPKQGGMFVWARVPSRYQSGVELSDRILHGANVFITPGIIFGSEGEEYVRVSLCSKEDKIQEAISRIKQFCML